MLDVSLIIDLTKSLFGLNKSSYDWEMKRQENIEAIE